MVGLPGAEPAVDLKDGIDQPHQADQDDEAGGKEIHDKFKGILELKSADHRFHAQQEEKKREKGYQKIFPPPENGSHIFAPLL